MGISINDILSSNIVNVVDAGSEKQKFDAHIHRLFRSMVNDVKQLLSKGYTLSVGWSKGKDSSCCLLGALTAIEEYADETNTPLSEVPLIVHTINTGVEGIWTLLHGSYEENRLRNYCAEKGINLELHVATPPLSERYASLFLSAHKLPSVGRLSNDCSVILKIDQSERVLKSVCERYDSSKLCTLIGSRSEESSSRAASIKRHGNDIDVEEVIVNGKKTSVFMPIRTWVYEDVMGLLSRAGHNPMVKPSLGFEIPAYADNFRVLKIIYKDGSDGNCPVTAHQVAGANKQGGCGTGSRFGCWACLKVKNDTSAENQNKKTRYKFLQGNLTKIRNYLYLVSQDIRHRTYHSRAIDYDTGYVVLQPNVLNSKTIERVALYMMQATLDDKLRAKCFQELVKRSCVEGDDVLLADAGYRDIMTDDDLSEEDKVELAALYKTGAQEQLVTALDFKGALYLDAVHARDGVRLPPYRMTWLYQQVLKGYRLPYPNVKTDNARIDTIPDAKMLPFRNLDLQQLFRDAELYELDFRGGCMSSVEQKSLPHTLSLTNSNGEESISLSMKGKRLPLHDGLKEALAPQIAQLRQDIENKDAVSMTVNLAGRSYYTLPNQVSLQAKKAERKKCWSRRNASHVTRNKKKTIIKGRSSVQFYRFEEQSRLSRAHMRAKPFWLPDWERNELPIYHHIDDSEAVTKSEPSYVGYAIDEFSLSEWMQWDGFERAMAKHDHVVAQAKRSKVSRYEYCGTNPFEHLLEAGVLLLNDNTIKSSQRIVARTNMFNAAGLFNYKDNRSLLSLGVSMKQYRQDKAYAVNRLRHKKQSDRINTRSAIKEAIADPKQSALTTLKNMTKTIKNHYGRIYADWARASIGLEMGLSGFDDVNYAQRVKVNGFWLTEIDDIISDTEKALSFLLIKAHVDSINSDFTAFREATHHINAFATDLNAIKQDAIQTIKSELSGDKQGVYWFWQMTRQYLDSVKAKKLVEKWFIKQSVVQPQKNIVSVAIKGRNVSMAKAFLANNLSI